MALAIKNRRAKIKMCKSICVLASAIGNCSPKWNRCSKISRSCTCSERWFANTVISLHACRVYYIMHYNNVCVLKWTVTHKTTRLIHTCIVGVCVSMFDTRVLELSLHNFICTALIVGVQARVRINHEVFVQDFITGPALFRLSYVNEASFQLTKQHQSL